MNEKKEQLEKRNSYYRKKRLERKVINKKVCRFEFRCTENEKAFLESIYKQLGYQSISEYILESILFNSVNYIELDYLKDFTVSINRLNNNINQIARNLNKLMNDEQIDTRVILQVRDNLTAYQTMIHDLEDMNRKLQRKISNSIRKKEAITYNDSIDYKETNMDTCPCSQ